jgi:uncharacterized DUF497 family protein
MRFEFDPAKDRLNRARHGLSLAFADRGDVRRVISLRRAERREVKHYVENFN